MKIHKKYEFHVPLFLGYIIGQEEIAMDEIKVAAVTEWPIPKKVKDLQCFLGFAHLYWHII